MMGCACGGTARLSKWELTTPTGEVRVYLTETEARVARTTSGGGTIRRLTE